MKITGKGKLLKIYIGETDQIQGKPLYHEIILKARSLGMAGATVYRGVEGYGANSRIHTSRILRLSEDLPMVIELIDTPERIDQFIPLLDNMVKEGLVIVVQDIEIIRYGKDSLTK